MPSFRFLHASDYHLERPPSGLAEAPDHLGVLLIDAPYRAAANVFEAALAHDLDFVVLAGDLAAPERSGPRAILFLREQFARLAERNIAVYWAGGSVDRVCKWPAAIRWPSNVHICNEERPQRFTATRRGLPLCEIVGQSLPSGPIDIDGFDRAISNTEHERFVIGLAHGEFDDAMLRRQHIDYWALGGDHEPTLPLEARPLIHYPGSPQGRSAAEAGPHGCTLVHVTDDGDIRTAPIITDVVRFASERLSVPSLSVATAGELERLLRERMQSLADANPTVALLVDVTLEIARHETGDAPSQAAQANLPLPAITGVLRGEFGYRSPPVWLDRVRMPPPTSLPEKWLQQETLLGDFLRAARRLEKADEPIDLDRYLPDADWREPLREIVQPRNRAMSMHALYAAAGLGAGLLACEEAQR